VTRQLGPDGTVSIFGVLHTGINLNTTPALSADDPHEAVILIETLMLPIRHEAVGLHVPNAEVPVADHQIHLLIPCA
jgi:hypothetical protein